MYTRPQSNLAQKRRISVLLGPLVDEPQLAHQPEETPVLNLLRQLIAQHVIAQVRCLELRVEARADHWHDLVDVAHAL